MPDVHDPKGPLHLFRGFAYWEDDQLIAALRDDGMPAEAVATALGTTRSRPWSCS
ncbi:hypothetical protein ACFVJ8_34195 [Streptomyces yangpuensis]|uniref:hypothetical protein n=1 Tax=Streptomyces yangpuensis TaxID=1648182 RepID=UPI00363C8306